jgi:hypothetical protein
MTLEMVLGPESILGWVALILMAVFWFALTVFILCIMEVRRSADDCGILLTDIKGSVGFPPCTPSPLG